MKMVYTHENRFLVNHAKNIIEASHLRIDTIFKNEYAAGAAGDLAPLDAWLELWVLNDEDYLPAYRLIEAAFENNHQQAWQCSTCHEKNEPSFDLCWNCQTVAPSA